MSALLVAATTMMPVLPSKPSISVSSWLSVCTATPGQQAEQAGGVLQQRYESFPEQRCSSRGKV